MIIFSKINPFILFKQMSLCILAYVEGDPTVLLSPRDSTGSRCGLDYHVRDRKYLMFFNLQKCIGPTVVFTGCKTTQVNFIMFIEFSEHNNFLHSL